MSEPKSIGRAKSAAEIIAQMDRIQRAINERATRHGYSDIRADAQLQAIDKIASRYVDNIKDYFNELRGTDVLGIRYNDWEKRVPYSVRMRNNRR